jgi:hypothetical protein
MSHAAIHEPASIKDQEHGAKNRRIMAMLGNGRSVSFTGENLTLDSLIESTEWLLGQLRDARKRKLRLSTFLRMLKDMAVT